MKYAVQTQNGTVILRTDYLNSARSIASTIGGIVLAFTNGVYYRIW